MKSLAADVGANARVGVDAGVGVRVRTQVRVWGCGRSRNRNRNRNRNRGFYKEGVRMNLVLIGDPLVFCKPEVGFRYNRATSL